MRPPDRFETARLTLRPATSHDAAALFDVYTSDPQATRYLSWRTHELVSETREFVEEADARWHRNEAFTWVLVPRAAPGPIGMVSAAPGMHGVEIGYVLGRDWWGRGLMVEAAVVVVDWLRAQPEVFRIWAYCAVDHRRSVRVMERVGLTYEATLRRWITLPNLADEPCDALVHSWTRPGRC
jgi:RimJ/RimL family protein N-acetyltransferase